MPLAIRPLIAALGLAIPVIPALAQEEPSFDCSKAKTPVEKVLCSGGNSGMGWIDVTMNDLYKAALQSSADGTALRASQRAWLTNRNKCSGGEDAIMNCLLRSYQRRFTEIAAPYDKAGVTGVYANKGNNGTLDAVLFPNQTLAASIDASLGAPSYNQCTITFRAPLQNGKLHYQMPADEDGDDGACKVNLTVDGKILHVTTSGCASQCGAGVMLDGTYKQ